MLLSFGGIVTDKTGPIVLPQAKNSKNPSLDRPFYSLDNQPDPIEDGFIDEFEDEESEGDEATGIDWITWGLGLLAFTTVLGLVPFWLFIYFSIRP